MKLHPVILSLLLRLSPFGQVLLLSDLSKANGTFRVGCTTGAAEPSILISPSRRFQLFSNNRHCFGTILMVHLSMARFNFVPLRPEQTYFQSVSEFFFVL